MTNDTNDTNEKKEAEEIIEVEDPAEVEEPEKAEKKERTAKITEFKPKKDSNKLKPALIVFIIILVATVLAYTNRDVFFPKATGDTVYIVGEGTDPYFIRYDSDMVVLTNDKLECITKKGNVKFSHGINYSDPVIRTDGNYILVYDLNGTRLTLYKKGEVVKEYETERPIKLAKVNESGYVAVATGSAGYKEQVILLNDKCAEIYNWQLSESYLLDIDISPNCKNLVASVISTESRIARGGIIFIDIDKAEVISTTNRNDSIFPEVRYINNNYCIAVGESEMIGFNGKGGAKWNVNYQGAILQSYEIVSNGNPVLAMQGSRNNTVLKMYNNRGKETGKHEFEEEVKAFDCVDGRIVAALKRDVIILGYNGREKLTKTADKDIRDIVFLSKNHTIVINADSAEAVKF